MKKTIYLLSILVLFQSCYSYKTFDFKEYETINPKKIKIELNDSRKFKGKVTEIKNDKIFIETKDEFIEMPISNIKKIKQRKFSLWKTSIVSAGVGVIVMSFTLIAMLTSGWK